jgi:hypothetical protein
MISSHKALHKHNSVGSEDLMCPLTQQERVPTWEVSVCYLCHGQKRDFRIAKGITEWLDTRKRV